MPIVKVPVVHHLGIISQTHKEDLQKRLFKQAEEIRASKHSTAIRNPFQINEEFIKQYNLSHGSVEQEKYVELAKLLLSRSKRRAGLHSLGEGGFVELPVAWTELLLLSLCCHGEIQNDSLDALLVSLDHAPVQPEQIPGLFFLAESLLYWVCTDTSQRHDLFSCEVKMLKLGYLVFLRLFLFHISGNLNEYQRSKSHLRSFLKALSECQSCYEPFPNVLFAVHFMLSTGEIICGQTHNESTLTEADDQRYDVNQVLWHSLLCWYCDQHSANQLTTVAQNLLLLKHQLHNHWVDSALGLMVLGEAAKSNMLCLQTLMSLHTKPDDSSLQRDSEERGPLGPRCSWPWPLEHAYTMVLADVCLHSSDAQIQKTALTGNDTPPANRNTDGLLSILRGSGGGGGGGDWRLRGSVVQALVRVWRGLRRAAGQDGLRNAAWLALQDQLGRESDPRVRDAARVVEAEMSVLGNGVFSEGLRPPSAPAAAAAGGVSGQMISWRLACTLSQLYLPPTPPSPQPCARPRREPAPSTSTRPQREPAPPSTSTRPRQKASSWPRCPGTAPPAGQSRQPTRPQEAGRASRQSNTHTRVDFNTRTDVDLRRVIEEQWEKELQIKMEEEREAEKEELVKKQKEEQERFTEIMRKRREKGKQETAPYELPAQVYPGL